MRVWQVAVRLGLMVMASGGMVAGLFLSAAAATPLQPSPEQEAVGSVLEAIADDPALPNAASSAPLPEAIETEQTPQPTAAIPQLSDLEQPAVTVQDWLAQIEAARVEITNVRVEATDQGLQITLETEEGTITPLETRSVGNALIADIPNATIAEDFSQAEPIAGIALVEVTQLPGDRVRVAITGTDAPPVAEVRSEGQNLVLGVAIGEVAAEDEEAIEVVVTGEQEEGYRADEASIGTRTDTPLRDVPASIQVIPQQVIEDQQATRLTQVLQNAPGVVIGGRSPRDPLNIFNIRGFPASSDILVDGLPDINSLDIGFGANIDRVEVLRGPASVLFGQGGLGGRVNLVTEQPLADPSYSIEGSVGSYNFYRGAIDLTGPLTDDETLLYRFNASAQTTESFIDFYDLQQYLIAPTLSWQLGDRTRLTLSATYQLAEGIYDFGIPPEGSVLPNPNGEIPRDRFVSEPDINDTSNEVFSVGYDLNHRFSDNLQMRSAFRASFFRLYRNAVFPLGLQEDGRTLNRGFEDGFDLDRNSYNLDNYLVVNFPTGGIEHELVAGFNLRRIDQSYESALTLDYVPLDIFDPVYGVEPANLIFSRSRVNDRVQQLGFYVQDQITFSDSLILLLGGRFDIASQDFENLIAQTDDFGQTEAFSPRVGIVYQPIEPISLYASYSRSFNYSTGFGFSAAPIEPERGEQYEIGIKADLTDSIAATLAFYDLTRSNLPTPDPDNPTQTILVGEQRSRGIEFDVSGEILPGWNVIAGYALTDAEITEDNTFEVGNQLTNVPRHAINLWTTYEIQSGDLSGLGLGLGLFYYSDRQADLANTVELPDYARTDAALFYNRGNFRAAINIRNLFDVDYFVSAQNRNRIVPGDPLTVVGTISWEF